MTADEVLRHLARPVFTAGAGLTEATAAMLLVHGRGASAHDILASVSTLKHPEFAFLALDAPDHTWYPNRFLAPLEENEPHLSASLALLDNLLLEVIQIGVPQERIILLGFSQGARLALEYAARHARRYGALIGLSGALIGPDGLEREGHGSLDGTPVFLGCSDVDFHVPAYRIEQTARHLTDLGGIVTTRLYPNLEHTIIHDELEFVHALMMKVITQAP